MLRIILPLLLLSPALGSTAADDGGLTLYLAPSGTPGILAFFLRPDLPPDPLFRPPFHIAAGGTEQSETVLRQVYRAEIQRGLPNRLPLPHAPDVALGEVEPDALVEQVKALGGGPAVLVVTDPGLTEWWEILAGELPGHRVMPGIRADWVGFDARYDPGSLEIFSWGWCDPCRSSGPFDDSFAVCGLCSAELGPVPPRLYWRDRLGRPRSREATVEWLAVDELVPQSELWYVLRGLDAEGR
ncbi:MAG: hypothetical protein NTW26_03175 [bacterium]|nr:hypothetical protein [bacterium]